MNYREELKARQRKEHGYAKAQRLNILVESYGGDPPMLDFLLKPSGVWNERARVFMFQTDGRKGLPPRKLMVANRHSQYWDYADWKKVNPDGTFLDFMYKIFVEEKDV